MRRLFLIAPQYGLSTSGNKILRKLLEDQRLSALGCLVASALPEEEWSLLKRVSAPSVLCSSQKNAPPQEILGLVLTLTAPFFPVCGLVRDAFRTGFPPAFSYRGRFVRKGALNALLSLEILTQLRRFHLLFGVPPAFITLHHRTVPCASEKKLASFVQTVLKAYDVPMHPLLFPQTSTKRLPFFPHFLQGFPLSSPRQDPTRRKTEIRFALQLPNATKLKDLKRFFEKTLPSYPETPPVFVYPVRCPTSASFFSIFSAQHDKTESQISFLSDPHFPEFLHERELFLH